MNKYNRMAPDKKELYKRIQEYSLINYGADAYPLSKAEAEIIVEWVKTLEMIKKVLTGK